MKNFFLISNLIQVKKDMSIKEIPNGMTSYRIKWWNMASLLRVCNQPQNFGIKA